MISNMECLFISLLCKQSCTKSSNSKIGSSYFRQDLLFLLSKFNNSLAYSLIKEMHSGKTGVIMVVYCEGLTCIYH